MDCTKKIFWVIYISYKLPISKRQARGDAEIALVKQKKIFIQKAFQQKIGLVVDHPKCGGSGT